MSEWDTPVSRSRTAEIDENELRRAVAVLFHPTQCHLIQSLPSGRWKFTTLGDPTLVSLVMGHADELGCYFSLNAIKTPLDHCLRSSDVEERRWFLIDIDTNRADTNKMATDEERESSRMVAQAVNQHLNERGWPAPVVIDSGNGWHLLYRIELPANKHTQATLRLCLKKLAERFDCDAAHVDCSTHDAKRISKLPGTWVRKGPTTDDRPHRVARMIHAPSTLNVVTYELLASLSGIDGKPEPPPKLASNEWNTKATKGSPDAYLGRALQNELSALALASQGNRNNQLNKAAFSLGQLVAAGLDRGKVVAELRAVAEAIGLGHDEIEKTISSGIEAGSKEPRVVPERNGKHESGSATLPKDSSVLIIVRASEITPKKVEFLWPGRIPLGKLTTFAGQGGIGKTFVLCDMAARITRGDCFPNSGGECFDPASVLFINGEDDEEDTIVPRLIECGANLHRVAFLKAEMQDNFYLSSLDMLTRAIDQIGQVRLVAIDPPTNYLGDADEHKNADIRALLRKYKNWCAERRISVILNTHVNKSIGPNADAASRVMGTVAWVNAVRSAHMFVRDPEDFDRTLFIGFKGNNAARVPGLAYKIVATPSLAKIEWLGEIDQTADEVVKGTPRKPRHVAAKEWLETAFKGRTEWPSDEIVRAAREAGVSRQALWEAKGILPIKARKTITADGDSVWIWRAEDGWPEANDSELSDTDRSAIRAF